KKKKKKKKNKHRRSRALYHTTPPRAPPSQSPNIPKLLVEIPGSLIDSMARAVAFKHLRSGDVTISVRKDEDKTLLSRSTKWIKMFGPEARVQVETYGVNMHSVRIKNLQLGDADKQLCAAQALVAANVSRLEELKSHESIKFIGWIKKVDAGLPTVNRTEVS
ncbi:hypothetical protein, partial [uncultured Nostoc sp.]|uniref:hypothetical protein n=1 Tax=uncultured Nostoc sp. TaxID=340711 RepID=UPI0035CC68B3